MGRMFTIVCEWKIAQKLFFEGNLFMIFLSLPCFYRFLLASVALSEIVVVNIGAMGGEKVSSTCHT